jgi:hypothetical protein
LPFLDQSIVHLDSVFYYAPVKVSSCRCVPVPVLAALELHEGAAECM